MSNGEQFTKHYDGLGRCGLRSYQRGLAHLPNPKLEIKVNKYAKDRGYEEMLDNKFVIKHNTKMDPAEFNKKQKEKLKKYWLKDHQGGSIDNARLENRRIKDVSPLEAKQMLL